MVLAGAALAAGALTAPTAAPAAVKPGRTIESFLGSNLVGLSGYPDQPIKLEVLRNGVPVGQTTKTRNEGEDIIINHVGDGDCFDPPATPDILPGDVLRVTVDPSDVDEATVRDVHIDFPVAVDPVAGTITVTGHARSMPDAPIVPGADVLELRMNKAHGSPVWAASGRRDLREDVTTLDHPGSSFDSATGRFVHVFDVGQADAADFAANPGEVALEWSAGAAGEELTPPEIFVADEGDGGIPGCPPLAETVMTATQPHGDFVNAANVGTDMIVSGVAAPSSQVNGVLVSVPGGEPRAAALQPAGAPGTPAGDAGLQTWTATIPSSELTAIGEGAFEVTATFQGSAPPAPQTRRLVKDVTAPPAPTVAPGAGTYSAAQTIILADTEADARIHFTNNGDTPTPASLRFTAPFNVTASQTIKAIAVDAAGNASEVASFDYTIVPASERTADAGVGPAAEGSPPVTALGPPSVGGRRSGSLTVGGLVVPARVSLARLRQAGLRVVMRLSDGTEVVRIAVYRARNGRRVGAPLTLGFRAPNAVGTYRIRLRDRALLRRLRAGRYLLEVTPGRSRAELGTPASVAFQVRR